MSVDCVVGYGIAHSRFYFDKLSFLKLVYSFTILAEDLGNSEEIGGSMWCQYRF